MKINFGHILHSKLLQIVCDASSITTNNKAIIDQLNCVSNAIYQIAGEYDLGDLWFDIYFPIIMHTNTIYGCEEKSQNESDA